jgi:putative NADPH-quinone reductase
MERRIVIVQGHPDASAPHFGHALADAYARAAKEAGHEVRQIEIARLDIPVLRSRAEWEGPIPPGLVEAQATIGWADHLVLIFPLWLGTMPALLKAFLEQVLRPGFAVNLGRASVANSAQRLKGKSARIVVTMGMPAFVYRGFFLSHGVRSLTRSILKFCGVTPVRETFIGLIEGGENRRRRALEKIRNLGGAGR